jgi:NTP pyrophosphatase (non-canonical NTP hydrolase)
MITDREGNDFDEAAALHRIVAVLDLRFPLHNSPGDRLGRLLEELGELSESVMALEHRGKRMPAPTDSATIAAKELQDVLCAIGGIAHHYDVPMRLSDPDNGQREEELPQLLALLVQAAGAVADAVHQLVGMGVKRQKYGLPNPERLAGTVSLAAARTLAIADRLGFRNELRQSIERTYQEYQRRGYLVNKDGSAVES